MSEQKTLDDKIDEVSKRLDSIDATLTKQHLSLEYHIKRCDLLEDQVVPIREQMFEIKGAVKFLKLVGVLASIAEVVHIYLR